ncbi:MAG: hypothetical protein QNJ54_18535 [Prochloraceae cyanobacterium]|nr:hypothetical protein [Prochloraceae cyanobacterium]
MILRPSTEWRYLRDGSCENCRGQRKDCRKNLRTNTTHCREPVAIGRVDCGHDRIGFGMSKDSSEVEAYKREQQALSRKEKEREQRKREAKKLEHEHQRPEEVEAWKRQQKILSRKGETWKQKQQREGASKSSQREIEIKNLRQKHKSYSVETVQEQKSERRESESYEHLLSEEQRHLVITEIINQLPLWKKHYRQLRERGLTDEEIIAGGYKSVSQWQNLKEPVDNRLAGVKLDGRSLTNFDSGIICPIKNNKGQFVSWQLRRDNCSDKESKYIWAAGEKKRFPKPTSHLRNGELPLAVHKSENSNFKDVLGLVDSVGIKPHIANSKLNMDFVGASGGLFAKSPQTLQGVLKENQPEKLVYYPDAGDVANSNIVRTIKQTIELVTEWGYQIEIAWWGQVNKSDGDIDEISSEKILKIKYLTPEKFFKIAEKIASQQKKEKRKKAALKEIKTLKDLTCIVNKLIDEPHFPKELAPEIFDAFKSGILNLKGAKGTGKTTLIKELVKLFREQGMNVILISPRIALGREACNKLGLNWREDDSYEWQYYEEAEQLVETSRQKDLLGNAERVNYEKKKVLKQKTEKTKDIILANGIGLCPESLPKLAHRDWSNTVVIIDEVELVFSNIVTSSTCKERRAKILKVLQEKIPECVNNRGLLILSDADLSNRSLNYAQALAPNAPVYTVINSAKPKRWKIDFYKGTKDKILQEIYDSIEEDVEIEGTGETRKMRFVVACDNQSELEALEKIILEKYPRIKCTRIDSTATREQWGQDFVKNPDEAILIEQPQILLYSPSMGVGCSIEAEERFKKWSIKVPWFDKVFGLFFGTIVPSQCRQMLARVRAAVPRVIWVKKSNHSNITGCRSYFWKEVKAQMLKYHAQESLAIELALEFSGADTDDESLLATLFEMRNPETNTWDNPHIDLWAKTIAKRNFDFAHLAEVLEEELREEGHEINLLECKDKTEESKEIKENKELNLETRAANIANAEDMPLEVAQALNRNLSLSTEKELQVKKALLKAELPKTELTQTFIHEAILKDRRTWLKQVKLWWMFLNLEKAKEKDRSHWRHKLKQFSEGVPFLPDVKTYYLKAKTISDTGIFDIIDINNLDKEYTAESFKELHKKACQPKMRSLLKTALNITASKQISEVQLAGRILAKVGMKLENSRTENLPNGKKLRYYKLVILDIENSRQSILDSLDQRYEELAVKKTARTEKNTSVGESFHTTEQTPATPSSDLGHLKPSVIYTNKRVVSIINPPHSGISKEGEAGLNREAIKEDSPVVQNRDTTSSQSDSQVNSPESTDTSQARQEDWISLEDFKLVESMLEAPDLPDEDIYSIIRLMSQKALNTFLRWIGSRGDTRQFEMFKLRLETILEGYTYQSVEPERREIAPSELENIASNLAKCTSPESLGKLKQTYKDCGLFSRKIFNEAAKLLPRSDRERLKEFALASRAEETFESSSAPVEKYDRSDLEYLATNIERIYRGEVFLLSYLSQFPTQVLEKVWSVLEVDRGREVVNNCLAKLRSLSGFQTDFLLEASF